MGIILDDGPGCGYIFAPNQKVQASISFVCDRSATGYGRVTASTTSFMTQSASSSGGFGGGGYAPGGASKPNFKPELFCNLNFTWSTSLVCGLPIPYANRGGDWGLVVILILAGVGGVYFGGGTYMNAQGEGADPVFWNNMPVSKAVPPFDLFVAWRLPKKAKRLLVPDRRTATSGTSCPQWSTTGSNSSRPAGSPRRTSRNTRRCLRPSPRR